jgi:DNA-binding MarR family transcriptional regulator
MDVLETSVVLRETLARVMRRLRVVDVDAPPRRLATVLRHLEREGPLTSSELAAREGMRPQSMAETVKELEALGFVQKTGDPDDGRRLLVSVTAAGRRRLAETRKRRDDWLAVTIAEQFDARERETLVAALELLDRLADA